MHFICTRTYISVCIHIHTYVNIYTRTYLTITTRKFRKWVCVAIFKMPIISSIYIDYIYIYIYIRQIDRPFTYTVRVLYGPDPAEPEVFWEYCTVWIVWGETKKRASTWFYFRNHHKLYTNNESSCSCRSFRAYTKFAFWSTHCRVAFISAMIAPFYAGLSFLCFLYNYVPFFLKIEK